MEDFLLKFMKFGVVGASGMIVDFSFTWICKEKLKIQKYIANGIGFTIAATYNYYINRVWTFHSHNQQVAREFSSFFIISLIGLGINSFFVWFFTSKMKWNFYFAKLIAIGITVIWNFLGNFIFTFS
jgi:putative flippase GtrA